MIDCVGFAVRIEHLLIESQEAPVFESVHIAEEIVQAQKGLFVRVASRFLTTIMSEGSFVREVQHYLPKRIGENTSYNQTVTQMCHCMKESFARRPLWSSIASDEGGDDTDNEEGSTVPHRAEL